MGRRRCTRHFGTPGEGSPISWAQGIPRRVLEDRIRCWKGFLKESMLDVGVAAARWTQVRGYSKDRRRRKLRPYPQTQLNRPPDLLISSTPKYLPRQINQKNPQQNKKQKTPNKQNPKHPTKYLPSAPLLQGHQRTALLEQSHGSASALGPSVRSPPSR